RPHADAAVVTLPGIRILFLSSRAFPRPGHPVPDPAGGGFVRAENGGHRVLRAVRHSHSVPCCLCVWAPFSFWSRPWLFRGAHGRTFRDLLPGRVSASAHTSRFAENRDSLGGWYIPVHAVGRGE